MLTGIDHLVIAVPDLEGAIAAYRGLGFLPVRGGRHPVGTHNALVAFADGAYLELIAFYAPNPQHRWWEPLRAGGGLVDFCLRTDDLASDAARLRQAGADLGEPQPMSRIRPDGHQVRWRLAIPRGADRGVAPFLIEDDTPREQRVPAETTHPNGVVGIGTLTVAAGDIRPAARWYEALLGVAGRPIERDDLDGHGVRFPIGHHRLELFAPRGPAGCLRAWLADRGPGPWAASLRTDAGPTRTLGPSDTLGVRLALEPASRG